MTSHTAGHKKCKTEREPTFWEFVQFVLKRPTSDNHWRSYSSTCALCSLHYDYVLRFEDLEREERLFLEDTGITSLFPPIVKNRQKKTDGEEYPTPQYMKMLRMRDFDALVELYEQDILLGGYNQSVEQLRSQINF